MTMDLSKLCAICAMSARLTLKALEASLVLPARDDQVQVQVDRQV
jgi:hypothetical protein